MTYWVQQYGLDSKMQSRGVWGDKCADLRDELRQKNTCGTHMQRIGETLERHAILHAGQGKAECMQIFFCFVILQYKYKLPQERTLYLGEYKYKITVILTIRPLPTLFGHLNVSVSLPYRFPVLQQFYSRPMSSCTHRSTQCFFLS